MDVPHRRCAAGGDACRKTMTAFRARLDELVRAGQLTREEAAELFRDAFPQANRDQAEHAGSRRERARRPC